VNFSLPPQNALEKLKVAATYLSLQKSLKGAAWGSIVWGVLALAAGYFVEPRALLDYVWLGIGLFLLFEGLWILRSSAVANPKALLVQSGALLILGLWDTVGIYFEAKSGRPIIFGGQIVLAGILQLISANSTYRSFPGYNRLYPYIEPAYVGELELATEGAWKARVTPGSDLIEFKAQGKKFKAKFMPDFMVALTDKGKSFLVAGRPDITLEEVGQKMLSSRLKVNIILENDKFNADMSPEYYQQWKAWLLGKTMVPANLESVSPF
jgi:hypothetical protein